MQPLSVLATDMDGTFIPLQGNEENRRDLAVLCIELQQRNLDLVYVTGRHYELVLEAINAHALPTPQWLICDVGSSIYKSTPTGDHQMLEVYHDHLGEIVGAIGVASLAQKFSSCTELRIQEPEKQGAYKLSYYCDAASLSEITKRLLRLVDEIDAPYRIVASVDPFTGEGLIDFLPKGVSKAYALNWWVNHTQRDREEVMFAGDSGNDLAALTAGYRSIIVANADATITQQATRAHEDAGWTGRLFVSGKPATSGVLEGLHFFANTKTTTIQ